MFLLFLSVTTPMKLKSVKYFSVAFSYNSNETQGVRYFRVSFSYSSILHYFLLLLRLNISTLLSVITPMFHLRATATTLKMKLVTYTMFTCDAVGLKICSWKAIEGK